MKFIKKLFLFLFALLFLLIIGGVGLTYLYQDEIVDRVKTDMNKNFNATVDFSSVDLSILRSFPHFNFQMEDFKITGAEDFEGLELVNTKGLEFTLDIMSVIKTERPIEIKSIFLNKPKIHVKVLQNGKSNYDIVKTTDTEATTTTAESEDYSFVIQLEKYSIQDGQITYEDVLGDLYFELLDLDHEGKGNFTQDVYDIYTKTSISSITAKTGGIKYVNRAQGNLDITLNADMKKMRFALKENELMLNALKLKADGFVEIANNSDVRMDLKFSAPGSEFKNFLSLIPSAYTKDFSDVKANGQLAFNGFVKGTYNANNNQMPAFQVNLDVKNGDIKYPDLPLGISQINTTASINSPSSDFDKVTVDIPQFKMQLGNNTFEASMLLKTPISDPDVDAKMNGIIKLDELAKAFPMEGVETLNGVINANMVAKTKMSYIDQKKYDQVDMSGDLQIKNMNYTTTGLPPVKIQDMAMTFTPQNVQVNNFEALLGKSDIKAKGTLDNILAYFSPEKTMTGELTMRSKYFNADEWLVEDPNTTTATTATGTPTEPVEVFDRFQFNVDGRIDKLDYDIYDMKKLVLNGMVSPSKVKIDQFSMLIGNSDVKGTGQINNVFDYLYKDELLTGNFNMSSKFMDLNQFMVETEDGATAKKIAFDEEVALDPILIPENIAVDINAKLDKVRYTNIDLNNVNGKLAVKDQAIAFKDCKAKTLGGNLLINGGYDTKDPDKPTFDFDTKVSAFSFATAFDKLNTFKALAPIGQYIQGKFNTTLKMNGVLGKDMMPDLSTLTADGFFHTLNGAIKSFKPLEQLGSMLNLNNLKTLKIKDTKNWFELKDGTVEIKEFDYQLDDIAMKVKGKHGLNQDMDYVINTKIPRKLLEKNAVGAAAGKGLDFLNKEASKLGVNIDVGEFIDVLVNVKGSSSKPKLSFKVLGASGEKTLVESVTDGVKAAVTEKVDEVKKDVTEKVEVKKEDFKKKMNGEIKIIMDAAEKQADLIRKAGKKSAEEARKLGYDQADNLIEKAGNNIFKKKAAELAAKKLKKETDKKVDGINQKAEANAEKVMAKAKLEVEKVQKKYQGL